MPARGPHFETWDPILRRIPNRGWRRFATDDLVRMVMRVQRRYAAIEPGELPMLVGDMSRARGGDFGVKYGIVGHSSHQNGLDMDVYYPRRDGERGVPRRPAAVDRRLADKTIRTGIFAASIAVGVFALTFIFAIFYIG